MPKFKFRKGDPVIWAVFICLCIISIIEVFSASSSLSYKTSDYISPILKHLLMLGIGVAAMIGVSNIKCKYFKLMTPLALLFAIGSLIIVLLFGESTNGAARWISILGIQYQPSEVAKGATILAEAQILAAMQTPGGADKSAFKYIMITAGIICTLILFENFSTALLLAIVVGLMMIVGGVSWKQLGPTIGIIGAIIAVFVASILIFGKVEDEPKKEKLEMVESSNKAEVGSSRSGLFHRFDTWKKRILKFTSGEEVPPEKFDLDEDGQVGHARIAIVNSNLIGRGPGNSIERNSLPQAFSDFIYAIIIEELGLGGAIVVMLLYIVLLFRTAKIANRCENSFPAFLIMGLALMLCTQAMFNMMVAVGLGPVTGQPLPLISKGGTSTILNCVYLGMILSVSHTAKKNPDLANA